MGEQACSVSSKTRQGGPAGPDARLSCSHLSIAERTPSVSTIKGRKKRNRRLMELSKPKTNWQCLKDR